VVQCRHLTVVFLRRFSVQDMMTLLFLFNSTVTVLGTSYALTFLAASEVSLVRGEVVTETSSSSNIPTQSFLASAEWCGLPIH